MYTVFVCGICNQKIKALSTIVEDEVSVRCPRCKTIHQYTKELPIGDEYKTKPKIKLCGRQYNVKKNKKRRQNIK